MRRCHYCGKILHELPYTCRRCGHIFCSDHRLPEFHNCHGRHHDTHRHPPQYCANCGRELQWMSSRCHWCGKIFCDDCQSPEKHGCHYQSKQNTDTRAGESSAQESKQEVKHHNNKKILRNTLRSFKEKITLRHFTIISLVLILIGYLSYVYPLGKFNDLFRCILIIGSCCFIFAYFLYVVKYWCVNYKLSAVFMISIPLIVLYLSTVSMSVSDNVIVYILINFCIYAIISAILLLICNKILKLVDSHIQKNKYRYYQHFTPKFSYAFLGIVVVSVVLISFGNPVTFSQNSSLVLQSASGYLTGSPNTITSVQNIISTPYPTIAVPGQTGSTVVSNPTAVSTQKATKTGLVSKSFPYVLKGKTGSIKLNLYSSTYREVTKQAAPIYCMRYNYDTTPCTSKELNQYYLNYLDSSAGNEDLDSLVKSIQLQTSNQDDQARIAISLAQQIPYDYAKLNSISSTGQGKTRYPYQVLYENTGVCSEKSLLLAYLLRGLGYSVVLFNFDAENHMAVGIKSPVQYSYLNSGYAFIESAAPTIPTDSQENYVGAGKLTSAPQILQISDGSSMTTLSEEYKDAQTFIQIESMSQSSGGMLDQTTYMVWMSLVNKYGIKTSSQ
jgi:predicted nucleic acid binding AN1-type Zn finger protein